MTEPEDTAQDTELDPKPSIDEGTADVNQGTGEEEDKAPDYQEAAEELASADYQTRMKTFDEVDASVPVVSLPVKSSDLDKSDLEV
jgi:hypothetical protein